MHDSVSIVGSMFTDWTATDPRYFYWRGFITGIAVCVFCIPLIKETLKAIFRKRP